MAVGRMFLFSRVRGEALGHRGVELVNYLMNHVPDELPSSRFALSDPIERSDETQKCPFFPGEKTVFLPKKGLIPDARSRRFSRSFSHGKLS